jgi:hypothetical protein
MIRYRPVRDVVAALRAARGPGARRVLSDETERAVVAAWTARDADLVAELIEAVPRHVEEIIHRYNVYRPEDS